MDHHVVFPSLLKLVNERKSEVSLSLFCLRLPEFCNSEKCLSNRASDSNTATSSKGLENDIKSVPAKHLKLSLSKENPRFATPLPEVTMTETSKGKKVHQHRVEYSLGYRGIQAMDQAA